MGAHQSVAHGDPVVEAMVQIAGPRLFLVVAKDQRGIDRSDALLYRDPSSSADLVFGWTCLKTSLVFVRACIAGILNSVGFGEENPEADTSRNLRIRRIKPLGPRNAAPSGGKSAP